MIQRFDLWIDVHDGKHGNHTGYCVYAESLDKAMDSIKSSWYRNKRIDIFQNGKHIKSMNK